jgi:hypothetical protein
MSIGKVDRQSRIDFHIEDIMIKRACEMKVLYEQISRVHSCT